MYACVARAGLILFGLFFMSMATPDAPFGFPADPFERYFALALVGLEMAIVLVAAWRFRQGKGWLVGSVVLVLFAIGIVMSVLTTGFIGILWYAIYLAIFLGLLNGIRGALALRSRVGAGDIGDTFE